MYITIFKQSTKQPCLLVVAKSLFSLLQVNNGRKMQSWLPHLTLLSGRGLESRLLDFVIYMATKRLS